MGCYRFKKLCTYIGKQFGFKKKRLVGGHSSVWVQVFLVDFDMTIALSSWQKLKQEDGMV